MKKNKENFRTLLKKINFEKSPCPDSEYILQYFNQELKAERVELIEQHLDLCPICLNVLQRFEQAARNETLVNLPDNWQEIFQKIDNVVYAHLDSMDSPKKSMTATSFLKEGWPSKLLNAVTNVLDRILKPGILAYASLIFVLGLSGMYGYALLKRPTLYSLALIQKEQQISFRTGNKEGPFTQGLKLYRQSRFAPAREQFKLTLENNPQHYLANYYTALTFLHEAKQTLFGVGYQFNVDKVEKGSDYLKVAQALAEDNPFYQQDCLWYLGKAFLMKGNPQQAKSKFQAIIEMNGGDSEIRMKAIDILKEF